MTTIVKIEVTLEQAAAIAKALEVYSRLCIGQLEIVSRLVRNETIPTFASNPGAQRATADVEACDEAESYLIKAKSVLGYPVHGSHGIQHPHVDITGHRAWEVKRVLSKAIAEHRDPSPCFRGVDYDGLIARCTTDPEAVISVQVI